MKKSELKKIVKEEYNKIMVEADIADTKLPSAVLAYLNKFLIVLKKVNLTKQQQLSVILHILDGIGVSQSDLSVYMSKVKGSLSTESIQKKLMESDLSVEKDDESIFIIQNNIEVQFSSDKETKQHIVNALKKCKNATHSKEWVFVRSDEGDVFIQCINGNDFLTIQQKSDTNKQKITVPIGQIDKLINAVEHANNYSKIWISKK